MSNIKNAFKTKKHLLHFSPVEIRIWKHEKSDPISSKKTVRI